ncbi:Protein-lysine N-methyltransferase efm5 [Dimargaris cristalligena]|uniref:Putative N6-adenine methyltransferase-domain-containing protein n=1 Tax=Dimargaris cristalligena TaxID=215637 RepID=A0A4Q0A1B8_9FUNG|nr:Protein-lysine N-methyltransferase efm5 [Dimargaris cristalligena]RKP39082.1 putative N6-adenine methyltransferase-domain-containing protein [Dimargaris cristalligena]|eukprot:RKP39082.1 putative N6-adenine methyltransferase-domain-containing protein [Dimargaris cristalligena]
MGDYESDDDFNIQLSGHALAALQEFMQEQKQATERFQSFEQEADSKFQETQAPVLDMSVFTEDWKYHESTAEFFAKQAIKNATGPAVMISSPSAFVKLKAIEEEPVDAYLFEFDQRFGVYGDQFVHFDYHEPTKFAQQDKLCGKTKFILLDPPYLEPGCFTKMAEAVKLLAAPDCKILVSTGYMVRDLVRDLLDARITTYEPRHQNGLANEFRSYTNYEDDELRWNLQEN